MFRVWWRRQWYAAMLAALMATGGLVMPQFSNAAPLALAAALPATTPQLCAWTRAAIGKTRFGDAGLIDTSATYTDDDFWPYPWHFVHSRRVSARPIHEYHRICRALGRGG